MTPGDRIDALLRTELHRADSLPVDDRYDAVLARSAQRTRRRRAAGAAVTLVVLAGIVTTVGTVGLERGTAPPPTADDPGAPLSGSWSRTIDGVPWTISFDAGAVLRIDAPAGIEGTDGASYDATASTLRLDAFANGACDNLAPGTYRWTVTGSRVLQLQAESEPCGPRRNTFDGSWTAAP